MQRAFVWPLLPPILAAACGGGGFDNPPAQDPAPTSAVAGVQAEPPLFSITGLDGPEAVRYDPHQDVYFVANWGPDADDERDANGFISRVDAASGEIQSLRFITGSTATPLHMPRGMFILGDTLWVADVDGVHGFHRESGEQIAFVDFREFEPGFLNDVAATPGGTLYVTDTGRGRIYRIREGAAEIAVDDPRTGPPNGITWDPDRQAFLLAPWGDETMLRAYHPDSDTIRDILRLPGGRFDGIEVGEAGVLVTSQADSSVYLIQDGPARPLVRTPGRGADIGLDTRRQRVAVPYIRLDRVDIWRVGDR